MPEYPWLIYRMSEGPLTTKEVHQGVNEQLNRKLGTDWGYSEYEWANLLQGFRPLPIRTASGTIAHFSDGADSVPMKSIVANITPIQSGTGTPSPSNPRPISGTNELTLAKTGKNLFPFDTVSGTTYAEKTISLEASTYTLSLVASGNSSTQMRTIFQYTDNSYGGECLFNKDTREAKTITLTKPVKALLFYAADTYPSSVGFTFEYSDIQLELGSTATTFEPYTAETYTIDLGQEIIGGTADCVGGVGSATWERKKIRELGTFSRYSNFFNVNISGTGFDSSANYLCEVFNNVGLKYDSAMAQQPEFSLGYSGNSLKFRYDSTTDPTQFLNDVGDYYIVHKITTPTDFTFTGQPINSLLGVNNVWTDSGEVLDVEYRSNF